LHVRICHRFREVRPDEARRNDRHAQLIRSVKSTTMSPLPA
jgi:hypothetical protein